ncbi:MAG: hypothetical protein U9P61_01935 [Patescibacteria group bacterium]|nr:hypothetical protein [Patescibacteria group bacterium]
MKKNKTENKIKIFPDNSGLMIYDLVCKYGMEEIQKRILEEMKNIKDNEELQKKAKRIPGRIIAEILKKSVDNEWSLSDISLKIKEELPLHPNLSEKLAGELSEKFLKDKENKIDYYREPIE